MIRIKPSLVHFDPEEGDPSNAVLSLLIKGFSHRCTTSVDVHLVLRGTVHLGVILPISRGARLLAKPTSRGEDCLLRFSQVEFAGEDELHHAAENDPALFAKLLVSIAVELELASDESCIAGRVVTEHGVASFQIDPETATGS